MPRVVAMSGAALARISLDDFSTAALETLEKIIDSHLAAYYYVGRSLFEIRERKLYRGAGHKTFEDYVLAKWGMSRSYAFRNIQAFRVTEALPIGNATDTPALPSPMTESHARELSALVDKPELLREAWSTALELNDGKPTAEDVRAIVLGVLGQTEAADPTYRAARLISEVNRILRELRDWMIEDHPEVTPEEWFALAKAADEVAHKAGEVKLRAEGIAGQFLSEAGR
jgi:hypothetical protein